MPEHKEHPLGTEPKDHPYRQVESPEHLELEHSLSLESELRDKLPTPDSPYYHVLMSHTLAVSE